MVLGNKKYLIERPCCQERLQPAGRTFDHQLDSTNGYGSCMQVTFTHQPLVVKR
jgi:hypothetical protein